MASLTIERLGHVLPIAHTGHWIVDVAYVSPFVGLLLWLGFTRLRERRRRAGQEEAAEGPEA